MSDGGAAQRSNMFKKGDVLTHVNGTDVQRLKIHQVINWRTHVKPEAATVQLHKRASRTMTLLQIKPLIVGPVGSMVSLQVERPSFGSGGPQQVIVKLKRASAMVAGDRCSCYSVSLLHPFTL
jgi:C-terminal processing protease CtpA/Prc